MKVTVSEQAQKVLGKSELIIITERVDDVALLIGQMNRMGLPEVLDKHIPRHWRQRGLSWGWTATIWLAYILTEGDHRKLSMEAYVRRMTNTLSELSGQNIEPLDFSDDRLAHLLRHLSNKKYWHGIERELNERSIEVYDLSTETVQCDATTVSGYHETDPDRLMQFGHSKDDPTLPQIKLMTGSLEPLGMPLVTDVLSGETADDVCYIPVIDRINAGLNKPGLLFCGDCKMSALAIRIHIATKGHLYLSPLPLTGDTAEAMKEWISEGIDKDKAGKSEPVFRENDRSQTVLAGVGYEFERELQVPAKEGEESPKERVLIICSPAHAEQQAGGLEQRLANAQQKIEALTPARGRGKRQITGEEELLKAITDALKAHRVEGLLSVKYEKQTEQKTQYVGRGRGSAKRETRTTEKVRYQIIAVTRCEDKIAALKERFGWKAFVTNAAKERLSLEKAVLSYRNEYRVERIFKRLKSQLNIAPLFVKRDDQIEGLSYLLTLGVRVLTLMEFVVRRSLQEDKTKLPDLHPENHGKETDKPTAERILKVFSGITLTIMLDTAGNEVMRGMSPLSAVQNEILQRLGLSSLYRELEIPNIQT